MGSRLSDADVFRSAAAQVANKLASTEVEGSVVTTAAKKLRTIAANAHRWDPQWLSHLNEALRPVFPHFERWAQSVVQPILDEFASELETVAQDGAIERVSLEELQKVLEGLAGAFDAIYKSHAQRHRRQNATG